MKNLFLFVSVIGLSVAFTSCTKDSVNPAVTENTSSQNNSTSTTGKSTSTGTTPTTTPTTTPESTTPTTIYVNLQGIWTVVSDSSFWAGETPKRCVSAYMGKSGDTFNFSKDGKFYINEDASSDTTLYSVDSTHRITVIYPDAKHYNEAPGFGVGLDPVGFDPTITVYFFQTSVDENHIVLNYFQGTPAGAASRVIYLKR